MNETATEILQSGGVVGLPTDTVYGIAAHPDQPSAIERLFELKGRAEDKPIAMLVASVEQAAELVALDVRAWGLGAAHWPGALTLVARAARPLPKWIGSGGRTVGVRVPDLDVTLDILEAVGPLAVTSANLAGEEPALSDEEARRVFGDRVDHYVPGVCPGSVASTVIDATGTRLTVLRQGPIEID